MLRPQVPGQQIRQQDHHQPGQRPVQGLPVQDLHHRDDPLQGQQGEDTLASKPFYKSYMIIFQLRSSLTENPPSSVTFDGQSQVRAA